MMKKLLILIVIIALAGGGWYGWTKYNAKSPHGKGPMGMQRPGGAPGGARGGNQMPSENDELPPGTPDAEGNIARSTKVKRDNIELTVSTTGKITANTTVEIKSKASGTITKLPYDISDHVTSGDLLCELDPVDELRNVRLKNVALESAKARVSQQEINLKIQELNLETQTSSTHAALAASEVKFADTVDKLARARALFQKQLLSKEDLSAAENEMAQTSNSLQQAIIDVRELETQPHQLELKRQDVKLAKASVLQSEVDLENAQQALSDTKIYAPSDGVITERTVQIGQIIASGVSNVGGGTVIMTIADVSHLYVDASVDEADIGKVKVGQNVTITTDAYIGKQFTGKISRVAAKGTNSNNVVTFAVRIEVDNAGNGLLRPEMTANIEIEADRRQNVLTLPNEAIQMYRGQNFVDLKGKNDTPTSVTIVTGLTDGLKTEVVSGLEDGQEVLYPAALYSKWSKTQGGNFAQSMGRAAAMSRRR
ncbi:efflux RND transporter periplasmic adaptor subunit [Candidatus Sumerlaeota bacterium]|nr:efflux RND transporter periplasmic adaptor subunit [Candidatus Sumerlaeota bacterium]